jgi:hypothetical protein
MGIINTKTITVDLKSGPHIFDSIEKSYSEYIFYVLYHIKIIETHQYKEYKGLNEYIKYYKDTQPYNCEGISLKYSDLLNEFKIYIGNNIVSSFIINSEKNYETIFTVLYLINIYLIYSSYYINNIDYILCRLNDETNDLLYKTKKTFFVKELNSAYILNYDNFVPSIEDIEKYDNYKS